MKRALILGMITVGVTYFIYQVILVDIINVNSEPPFNQHCSELEGMAFVKGGTFSMGSDAFYPEEFPVVQRTVQDFYMDRHEVTNAQYSEFVNATGYITLAERVPSSANYPDIPPELLKAGSAVFVKLSQTTAAASLDKWWHFTEGANWNNPIGPNSNIVGKEKYPVIHIAFKDAEAYAKWKGHRLPTEEEYEYAARGGLNGAHYETGISLTQKGKYIANTWQGLFPFNDSAEDGYVGLAPVGCFAKNHYGIYDLIGNVWEWTQSVYYPLHFESQQRPANLPPMGYDKNQPGLPVRVVKGGSYLCAEDFCMRYRPAARQAQDTGLGTSHIGFRTVKDV